MLGRCIAAALIPYSNTENVHYIFAVRGNYTLDGYFDIP